MFVKISKAYCLNEPYAINDNDDDDTMTYYACKIYLQYNILQELTWLIYVP